MFLIKQKKKLVFIIVTICICFSNADDEYFSEYKTKSYDDFFSDYVVELPLCENSERKYSQNKRLRGSTPLEYSKKIESSTMPSTLINIQNNDETRAVKRNTPSEYSKKIESSTISSTLNNIQNNDETTAVKINTPTNYIEIEPPEPEDTTEPFTTVTAVTEPNDLEVQATSFIGVHERPIQYRNSFKMPIQKGIRKKNFRNKFQSIPINKKIELPNMLSQKIPGNFYSQIQNYPNNFDMILTDNSENNTESNWNAIAKESKFQNNNTTKRNESSRKCENFTGFGHTAKTLQNFLNMNKLFTDILQPVEEKLELQNKPKASKANFFSLLAKAASLKPENDSPLNKLNTDRGKHKVTIGKLLKKRSNLIQKDMLSPNEESNLDDDEKQKQLARGIKNFKLTMNMLANIDMYVSSLLNSYIESLSNYVEHDNDH